MAPVIIIVKNCRNSSKTREQDNDVDVERKNCADNVKHCKKILAREGARIKSGPAITGFTRWLTKRRHAAPTRSRVAPAINEGLFMFNSAGPIYRGQTSPEPSTMRAL